MLSEQKQEVFIHFVRNGARLLMYELSTDYNHKYADCIECFRPYYDQENHKYQGFFFGGVSTTKKYIFCAQEGIIPSIAIANKELKNKFEFLENNPGFFASIQGRDEQNGARGGAIRSSIDLNFFIGGTGLPELLVNLLIAHCMYSFGLLNIPYMRCVVNYENPYIQKACNDIGLSENGYYRMRCLTKEVVGRHQ